MGRPTKYDPSLCEILPDLFREGASIAEVCVKIGITKDTFYRWKTEYPDFSDAVKAGEAISESWWTDIGMQGMLGNRPVNPTLWIFNMKNRFHWTDKHEVTGAESGPLQITYKVVNADRSEDQ